MRVKDKLRSREVDIGEELIQDTLPNQNTSTDETDDDIDIKYEEIGFPFLNSTSDSADKSNLDPDNDTMPNIPHVACGSDKTEKNDQNEFYIEHLQCVRGCETCQKYIEILRNHIRATHTPLQPIEDPLPIDQSLSIPIKCEVDEDIEKIGCSEQQDEPKLVADLDIELDSGSESDPHKCAELTQSVRPQSHSFKKHGSRRSKISKINKRILPPRSHFKCNECSKSFKYLSCLTEHRRIHTGEKPFMCDVCVRTFSKTHHLMTHMRCHTGEKPYRCAVCAKRFTRSNELVIHKRIHTGEKPYECTFCKICFTSSSTLTNHTRIHTGDKPYHCDTCERSFSQSSGLTTHKRTHTGERPYKCDECVKNFSCQSNLTTHMRIHRGEKLYECDQCEKSFAQKIHLTVHRRSHTGEKPFNCDKCAKNFSTSSNLTQHKKRFHTKQSTHKD